MAHELGLVTYGWTGKHKGIAYTELPLHHTTETATLWWLLEQQLSA